MASWVYDIARERHDAEFELIDLKDYPLSYLDEAALPSTGQYAQPHTKAWAEKIRSFDGFIFVTPEYNHGVPGALKNAIDFIYAEWNNKSAGFVSYGSAGGVRAVEHLRGVMAELQVADVRASVSLPLSTAFENYSVFKPQEAHRKVAQVMLDQVIAWAQALRPLRAAVARGSGATA